VPPGACRALGRNGGSGGSAGALASCRPLRTGSPESPDSLSAEHWLGNSLGSEPLDIDCSVSGYEFGLEMAQNRLRL
jgi:hypothetical protein